MRRLYVRASALFLPGHGDDFGGHRPSPALVVIRQNSDDRISEALMHALAKLTMWSSIRTRTQQHRRCATHGAAPCDLNNARADGRELYSYSRVAVTISLKLENNHG